jgi:hypothetical protein
MAARPGFAIGLLAIGVIGAAVLFWGMHVLVSKSEIARQTTRASRGRFTGADLSAAKSPDEFRIVLIGGEFCAGLGFPAGESLREQLQKLLERNVSRRKIAVSACFAGYASPLRAESAESLETALGFRPDLVALFVENAGSGGAAPTGIFAKSASDPLGPAGPAIATDAWARSRDALARRFAKSLAAGESPDFSLQHAVDDPGRVASLAERCAKQGTHCVVAIVPHPLQGDDELRALAGSALVHEEKRTDGLPSFDVSGFVAGLRKNNITVLDYTSSFREGSGLRRMSLVDFATGRWNAVAANVAAAQIAQHCISSGIIK